jgi:hypothetical protein
VQPTSRRCGRLGYLGFATVHRAGCLGRTGRSRCWGLGAPWDCIARDCSGRTGRTRLRTRRRPRSNLRWPDPQPAPLAAVVPRPRRAQLGASGSLSSSQAAADGHPFFVFFVSEIVHLLATDSDVDVLPQEVRAVVSQRLGMFSEDCQQLLALASVVGREFSTEVLATASGGNSATVVDDLQEAVVISMLLAVRTTPGRCRFTYELVREVLWKPVASYYWLSAMLRCRPVRQLRRGRASSGRQTSRARQAGPTGSPVPRSGTAGGSSGSQIMNAANPCPHCSMRHCVRCPRTTRCGRGCSLDLPALRAGSPGGPVEARRQLLDTPEPRGGRTCSPSRRSRHAG